MLITVETLDGPRKVNVCDECRTVCIPWPQRYCSGRCAREARERVSVKPKPNGVTPVSGEG